MPIHDGTRVFAGAFHDFHHSWVSAIGRALNRGILPTDFYAMAEPVARRRGEVEDDGNDDGNQVGPSQPIASPLHVPSPFAGGRKPTAAGGVAVADAPPRMRFRVTSIARLYAAKAKAVVVRHQGGHEVVAVIELVSPGNKVNARDFRAFVDKTQGLLAAGVHVLVIDLFPPTRRDPEGLHPEIFREEGEDDSADGGGRPFRFSPAKPLTWASYVASRYGGAYVEPLAVGDPLPDGMPVFLTRGRYVPVPLEATYRAAFDAVPAVWRAAVEGNAAR